MFVMTLRYIDRLKGRNGLIRTLRSCLVFDKSIVLNYPQTFSRYHLPHDPVERVEEKSRLDIEERI